MRRRCAGTKIRAFVSTRTRPSMAIRPSRGRIRPQDISPENAISSFRIADAQINYDGKGFVSRSAKPGLINRILSFLGLGLPVTEPSLGMLISNGFPYMMSGRYWISFYPGVALIILIVAINIVGDQIRDQFNPRLRR